MIHARLFARLAALFVAAMALPLYALDAASPEGQWPVGKTWGDDSQGFHLAVDDEGLVVKLDGAPLATYVYRHDKVKRPFFAHVRTPGGLQATRSFPPIQGQDADDHAEMHPGVWLAFAGVSGVDFWRNKGRIVHERFLAEPTAGDAAEFATMNRLESPQGEVVCRQRTAFSCSRTPDGWLLAIDAAFSSDKQFFLAAQEEMGLGIRVASPLTVARGGAIVSSAGGQNEKGTWGKIADWWDYHGALNGRQVGLMLMSHPANGEVWSHSRDYGLLVANPLPLAQGNSPPAKKVVKPGESFRLRFGILVHERAGDTPFDRAQAYRQYLEVPEAKAE